MRSAPAILALWLFAAGCSSDDAEVAPIGAKAASQNLWESSILEDYKPHPEAILEQAARRILEHVPESDFWGWHLGTRKSDLSFYSIEGNGTGLVLTLTSAIYDYPVATSIGNDYAPSYVRIWILPASFDGMDRGLYPTSFDPPQKLGESSDVDIWYASGGLQDAWPNFPLDIAELLNLE
jgi:hypothetical protein